MRTGEAGSIIGVDGRTVKNWTDHPTLSRFFSGGARGIHGGSHRLLTESDLLVLNTIRHLRTTGKQEWDEIAAYLDTGQREQEFPQNAISMDTRTVPLQQAEQSGKALATLAERDAAVARVKELEAEITHLRMEHKEEVKQLSQRLESFMREIAELNRVIGKLEGRLETRDEKN